MYLHIGNNTIIKIREIIGIFDINSLKETGQYTDLLQYIKDKEEIKEDTKTIILTKDKEKLEGYVSNISSTTLAKRAQSNIEK